MTIFLEVPQIPLNSRERDARHNVHSNRSRGMGRGTKGSLSARDIHFRSRRTSARGKNAGRTSGGTFASSESAVLKWLFASLINRSIAARDFGVGLPENTSAMPLP